VKCERGQKGAPTSLDLGGPVLRVPVKESIGNWKKFLLIKFRGGTGREGKHGKELRRRK